MLIVGLTGGIACGKSSVSALLRDSEHLTVIDADLIARQVVEPGTKAYRAILDQFQHKVDGLVNEDGSLNRASLGRFVFGKPKELAVLNSITHPAVRHEIFKQIVLAYLRLERIVVLDVPLLFEAGLDQVCGVTVTVVCDEDTQLRRLLKRNPDLSVDDAQKRIASQMSNHDRIRVADRVIDNSGSLDALRSQVSAMVAELKPSLLRFLLECFPPFALLSAAATFTVRKIRGHGGP